MYELINNYDIINVITNKYYLDMLIIDMIIIIIIMYMIIMIINVVQL